MMDFQIRPAEEKDVAGIAELVASYAEDGTLLPRSVEDIGGSLPHWLIAEHDGRVVGCGSLVNYSAELVEIRSIAVRPEAQGYGIGKTLTESLIKAAREQEVKTLFALTRITPFFEGAGFSQTHKDAFPEKVYRDCIHCPLLERCDEDAVVMKLNGAGPVSDEDLLADNMRR